MPFALPAPGPVRAVRVEPSAAVEMSWLLYSCAVNPSAVGLDPGLQARIAGFWDDGCEMQAEVLVLAQQLGCLTGWSLDPLFDLGRRGVPEGPPPPLVTETDEVRAAVAGRLRRLREDAGLRRRLGLLFADVWAEVHEPWERAGRPAVERVAARMRASLDHGARPLDLVPADHIALRDDYAALTRRAVAEGTLLLSPSHAAGRHGHVVDLPGAYSVALPTGVSEDAARRRGEAEAAAAGLKLLGDPTRLLLLREIEDGTTTVGELARRVGVSQPAASVHLRLLREAGLVEVSRSGGSTRYAVRHTETRRVLAAAAAVVPGATGAGGELNAPPHNGA